ncbi:hypothetical protein IF1G_05051 [Cordyceps javanica]|uniref:Uncharacterized protein n=1 Tax=Cordyceps javanica TaxID=43265 RepID=A0A545V427_9HYPO|nr:hypothetical protein IF1G_05051 [Cordyceps javanica]
MPQFSTRQAEKALAWILISETSPATEPHASVRPASAQVQNAPVVLVCTQGTSQLLIYMTAFKQGKILLLPRQKSSWNHWCFCISQSDFARLVACLTLSQVALHIMKLVTCSSSLTTDHRERWP